MASLTKQWEDGGLLSVTYDGERDSSATFTSDVNEGVDREMDVTFADVSGEVQEVRTVRQLGRREVFNASDGAFILADGGIFNTIKDGLQ